MNPAHDQSIEPLASPEGWASRSEAAVDGVAIGTPCYGGMVTSRFAASLMQTQRELDRRQIANAWIRTDGESLVQRARNNIAAIFLANATLSHLVFVDADIEWEPRDITLLLAHDVDVVCGLYPKKQYPIEYAFHPVADGNGHSVRNPITGAVEIAHAATGFLCIRRPAFLRLIEAYPESRIRRAQGVADDVLPWLHDFFPTPLEDGILWSEDYGFCRRWRAIGGKVWADTDIKLTHTGAHAFEGDPSRIYRLASE